VKLTPEQIAGLDLALDEATLLGLEVFPERGLAAATFAVLTLPEQGPPPKDRRRQFLFRVGRVAASLRHGRWNDLSAPVEPFTIDKLLSVVQSFGGAPIYGREFIDCESYFARWSNRLSLDLVCDSSAMEHSIQLFQEGAMVNKILDICLWFRDLQIRDELGNKIALDEFIAGGKRWWDGLYSGDPRTEGFGIGLKLPNDVWDDKT
jgi:hypothetical protein